MLLGGCTANPVTTETSCSCSNYLPSREKPEWVGIESNSVTSYFSHGVSECTGIQPMDFKEADMSARSSLSHLISTYIESEVELIQEDINGVARSRGKSISKQSTSALLEKSVIYDRWLDNKSCVIYSAVKISQSSIQTTIKRIESENKQKILNQFFSVQAEGKNSNKLINSLQQLLINSGVKKIKKIADKKTYVLRGSVTGYETFNQKKLAKVTIQLEIIDPQKTLIWSHQATGKGVSFGGASKNQLFNKALNQAIANSLAPITEMLHK